MSINHLPGMLAGDERWNRVTSKGAVMTTLLRREFRVDHADFSGVGDVAIPAAGAIPGRTGASPVMPGASRITPINRDPEGDIDGSARLPGLGAGGWTWQQHAACKGMDSSRFFPPEKERATAGAARITRTKKVCADCLVLVECRAFALQVREPHGVWGGLSEHEREEILGTFPADSGRSAHRQAHRDGVAPLRSTKARPGGLGPSE